MFAFPLSGLFSLLNIRYFRIHRTIVASVLISACVQALAQDISYQSMQFKGKSTRGDIVTSDITMPFFSSSKTDIASYINDKLFIGQLEMLAPTRWKPFFGDADGTSVTGIENQSFTVSRLDQKVITVDFDTEYCGAYCEASNYFYNFETQSGRYIVLSELVTKPGAQEILRRLKAEKIRQYRDQLRQLRLERKNISPKRTKSQQDEIADIEDRIALNTQCLNDSQASLSSMTSVEALTYLRYKLLDKELMILSSRCSNHASRALDDVGEISVNISYDSLRPHLSKYGQALLFEGNVTLENTVISQVLRGKLGNNAITMVIQADTKDTVSAIYFYDKYRKAISLFGSGQNGMFELIERNEDGQEQAKFQLKTSGTNVYGYWLGKSKLKVELRSP
ncbi:hypothetical protein H8K35_16615 [Undibacterium sp. LX40W]|uniref:Uncharacterized protein n=1 Tax=Undibacterium nitidum TaxID=2762298 RepID=A0A923KU84_9BURK|nr:MULTISPECIES: hypothetical protein [Undibacterium]MBC3883021.1 hypothetical protein [Undibacterium nitidum]MBC3893302.1 hypothetical protein [Undibacterium sp. LX40W]